MPSAPPPLIGLCAVFVFSGSDKHSFSAHCVSGTGEGIATLKLVPSGTPSPGWWETTWHPAPPPSACPLHLCPQESLLAHHSASPSLGCISHRLLLQKLVSNSPTWTEATERHLPFCFPPEATRDLVILTPTSAPFFVGDIYPGPPLHKPSPISSTQALVPVPPR